MIATLQENGIIFDSIRAVGGNLIVKLHLTNFNAVRAVLSAQVYSNITGKLGSDSDRDGYLGEIVFCDFLLIDKDESANDQLKLLLEWIAKTLYDVNGLTLAASKELRSKVDALDVRSLYERPA